MNAERKIIDGEEYIVLDLSGAKVKRIELTYYYLNIQNKENLPILLENVEILEEKSIWEVIKENKLATYNLISTVIGITWMTISSVVKYLNDNDVYIFPALMSICFIMLLIVQIKSFNNEEESTEKIKKEA